MIAHDLYVCAQQLNVVGADELPLAERLELAARLRQDADCLAAVTVDSARQTGLTWKDVASAAGLTEGSARARWGGERVSRLVAARTSLPGVGRLVYRRSSSARTSYGVQAAAQARAGAQELGTALHALRARSGVSLRRVSAVTSLPVPLIVSMLGGGAVVSWPETYMVSHALGGEPQDMRQLWQEAWAEPTPGSEGDGASCQGTALCGARLAAGLSDVDAECLPDCGTAQGCALFRGEAASSWPRLRRLLVALGADPSAWGCLGPAAGPPQQPTEGEEH